MSYVCHVDHPQGGIPHADPRGPPPPLTSSRGDFIFSPGSKIDPTRPPLSPPGQVGLRKPPKTRVGACSQGFGLILVNDGFGCQSSKNWRKLALKTLKPPKPSWDWWDWLGIGLILKLQSLATCMPNFRRTLFRWTEISAILSAKSGFDKVEKLTIERQSRPDGENCQYLGPTK